MKIGNATIQIKKALEYENQDFVVLWCENPDGYFPCNIDLHVKVFSSTVDNVFYDYHGMMGGTNLPRSLVGVGGVDESETGDGKDPKPDYTFENLNSTVMFRLRCLGYEDVSFSAAVAVKTGTLDKAFFEARDIIQPPVVIGDNTRKTVRVNGLTWMAENLDSPKGGLFYNNDPSHAANGRLYTQTEARTLCPKGWRLPTSNEWASLISYSGGASNGKKLKSKEMWPAPNQGDDEFGFCGIPGGFLRDNGFSGQSSVMYAWASDDNSYFRLDNNMLVESNSSVKRCSVRYVKDLGLADTAPRVEGEMFTCEHYLEMTYGTTETFYNSVFKDKNPLDGKDMYSYNYPIRNISHSQNGASHFALMFRDDNDEFHCIEPPEDWLVRNKVSQEDKYKAALGWIIYSGRDGNKRFFYWFRGVTTRWKQATDARVPANWTSNLLPVITMDPLATYDKRGLDQGFQKINPYEGFDQDTYSRFMTPFFSYNSFAWCTLVMDRYDSIADWWDWLSTGLFGYSWIFLNGIDYRIPKGVSLDEGTSPGSSKGDIIRPDSGICSAGVVFLWFRGKCLFERRLDHAAGVTNGVMHVILDGEIDAVDNFLSKKVEWKLWKARVFRSRSNSNCYRVLFACETADGGLIAEGAFYGDNQTPAETTEALARADADHFNNHSLFKTNLSSLYWPTVVSSLKTNAFPNAVSANEHFYGANYDMGSYSLDHDYDVVLRDLFPEDETDREGVSWISMFLEWVSGSTLRCDTLRVGDILPNDCSMIDVPDTDLVFVAHNNGSFNASDGTLSLMGYGDRANMFDWNSLISVRAKSVTFEDALHCGYRLLSPSVWESGITHIGYLEFRADAEFRGIAGGSTYVKAVGCSLSFDAPGPGANSCHINSLTLDNSRVVCNHRNTLFPDLIEAYGECSVTLDLTESSPWSSHFVNTIVVHDGARLTIEAKHSGQFVLSSDSGNALSDGGVHIVLDGDCELIWDIPWECFYYLKSISGKSRGNPAVLTDVQGSLRLAPCDDNDSSSIRWVPGSGRFRNALVRNALAVVNSTVNMPFLENSEVEYEDRFMRPNDNEYVQNRPSNNVVPGGFWHFRTLPKLSGEWLMDPLDGSVAVFRLRPGTVWDISRYYAITTDRGYVGEFVSRDEDSQEIRIRIPEGVSYLGRCAVACREDDGTIEESTFLLWKSLESELTARWNLTEFKVTRTGTVSLHHPNGLWIGNRDDMPEFELWFCPDVGNNAPWTRVDMAVRPEDVTDVKNMAGTNVYTTVLLRLNLGKWPLDIPDGRIEIRFMLGDVHVSVARSVRVVSTVADAFAARFHSHDPSSRQLLGEPGSVMLDVMNVNSWNEAVLDDVAEVANELAYVNGKPSRGIAEFVPFQHGNWHGLKMPIKNERGVVVGARMKLRVIGAGSVKVRVNQRGTFRDYEDRGWMCDERLRENLGRKLDIVRWLPIHLRKSEFAGFVKRFEDSLNNCFADNDSNSPVGMLEKIARLSDLRNPDRIEPRYFQDYADLFGIELNAVTSVLESVPENEKHLYVRQVLKAYSQFQKEKTTLTSLQTLMSMFGVFCDIAYMHSTGYKRHDESDWSLQQSGRSRKTQHFMVKARVGSEDVIQFSSGFRQLINDIKPVTTVFKGWMGWMEMLLEDTGDVFVSIASNVKMLNVIDDSETDEPVTGDGSRAMLTLEIRLDGKKVSSGRTVANGQAKPVGSDGLSHHLLPYGTWPVVVDLNGAQTTFWINCSKPRVYQTLNL